MFFSYMHILHAPGLVIWLHVWGQALTWKKRSVDLPLVAKWTPLRLICWCIWFLFLVWKSKVQNHVGGESPTTHASKSPTDFLAQKKKRGGDSFSLCYSNNLITFLYIHILFVLALFFFFQMFHSTDQIKILFLNICEPLLTHTCIYCIKLLIFITLNLLYLVSN